MLLSIIWRTHLSTKIDLYTEGRVFMVSIHVSSDRNIYVTGHV